MGTISFTKMHGLGNDYIYIECMNGCPDDLPFLSRAMSPRHTSVGADGIIAILPSDLADFKMRIFNTDGSEAKMCGNGSRCVGKFVYDHGLTDKKTVTLETLSGVKILKLHTGADGKVDSVEVDMGAPEFRAPLIPVIPLKVTDKAETAECKTSENIADSEAEGNSSNATEACFFDREIEVPGFPGGTVALTAVSMGNPHGVIFTDVDVDTLNLEAIGPALENNPIWPDRANIEFVNIFSGSTPRLKMRVWERGSGETMACGTGACAVASAFFLRSGLLDISADGIPRVCPGENPRAIVELLGGDLDIRIDKENCHVMMTGPATEVFSGTYTIA